MSNYNDEDFDNESSINIYSEDDDSDDNDYLLKRFSSVNALAEKLTELNSKEKESNIGHTLNILTKIFMKVRLENGLKSEDLKRCMLSRMMEILPSFTAQELVMAYKMISDASNPDLDRIMGDGKSGININMDNKHTINKFDNSVTNNQVNQNLQVNYANEKAVSGIDPNAIRQINNLSEASNIFKQIGVPRQANVEFNPNEKILVNDKNLENMVEANFKEIKKEEKEKLNEE